MSDRALCAGCQRDGDNTSAGSWCSDCGELVCNACAKFHKQLSPPHTFVPNDQVQNLSSTLLELCIKCEYHPGQKIVFFCSQHDCVLCDSCMSESHKSCKPIISIEKAAKGVKNGAAVFDLESRMENLCQVVQNTLGDQIRYKEKFQGNKKEIGTTITEMKTPVIEHIHKLEETIIKDLDQKYTEHEDTFIKDLDKKYTEHEDTFLLLLPNYNDDKIHVCLLDGSNSRSIQLSYNPHAVSIYDSKQALVTSNHRGFIEIVDLENLKTGKNIQVGLECKGITSVSGNICVRGSFSSLSMVDIDGIELTKTSTTSDPLCLSLNKANEIYFTAVFDDNVYVIKSDGIEHVFYNNPGLKDLYGIAVDDNNDVYVADRKSTAIYRISQDGQKQDIDDYLHEVVFKNDNQILDFVSLQTS
ncbi:unnamed protein product [Mytilus coruscus]|uniref:B box-type domain-containing protein n=1 Tax=Mytilus coruscus TaxID=42192 RepID=A0A6J8F143_MYTCO|nr:unnamed protein product [Mytilus coruscus]